MSNRDRVSHATRNYSMPFGQVQKAMKESACFVWVIFGKTFRNATAEEAAAMRKEQAHAREVGVEVLGSNEVPGLRFVGPVNPIYNRNAYEEMDSPLGVRTCHWPRIAEANRLAAQNG